VADKSISGNLPIIPVRISPLHFCMRALLTCSGTMPCELHRTVTLLSSPEANNSQGGNGAFHGAPRKNNCVRLAGAYIVNVISTMSVLPYGLATPRLSPG
jgi:hypothetical protein